MLLPPPSSEKNNFVYISLPKIWPKLQLCLQLCLLAGRQIHVLSHFRAPIFSTQVAVALSGLVGFVNKFDHSVYDSKDWATSFLPSVRWSGQLSDMIEHVCMCQGCFNWYILYLKVGTENQRSYKNSLTSHKVNERVTSS